MSRGRVLWHIGILSPKHIRPGVAPIAHARGVGNTWIVNRVLLPKPVVPLKGWGTDSVDGRDVRLVCDGHSWAFCQTLGLHCGNNGKQQPADRRTSSEQAASYQTVAILFVKGRTSIGVVAAVSRVFYL